jgi:predicted nuclease with TOPRIM domain
VALQDQTRSVVDERQQLEATITALRAQLEAAAAEHSVAAQEMKRAHRDEMSQLEATIRELRGRLEEKDGN